MIDWLIDWLANYLSDWMVDRKTDRIPVGLTGWQCDSLTDLKVERLIHVDKKLTEWFSIVWVTDCLTDSMITD